MKLSQIGLVDAVIQYHDSLNPAAWNGWNMKPEVRRKLLDIASLFADSLEIDNLDIIDVRLAGSMSNFNWTKHSDFDLHLVVDFDELNCDDLTEVLFRAKKTIWNANHDITINGHDVEMYVEDLKDPPASLGYFSVKNNRWLHKPEFVPPSFDRASVNRKTKQLMDEINKAIKSTSDSQEVHKLLEKLRRMRQSGLDAAGEFSTENLAYKALRQMGYLNKLYQAHNDLVDKNLSL